MNIYEFIKNLNVKVLVEIGCWNGNDSEKFKLFHPNARIIGFEPDPRNVQLLKQKGIDNIIELHPYALSNEDGEAEFYLSDGLVCEHTCSSSLKKPLNHLNVHPLVVFPRKTIVTCIKLDNFEPLKDTVIDFIWADVQGAEDIVFSGAKETLKRTRYVYTEYSNDSLYEKQLNLHEILKLFGSDWEIVEDFGGDVLLRNIKF